MTPTLSIVIPVFNEKESIGVLHNEILSVLRSLQTPFEIIFIDDGSTDGSLDVLRTLKPARVIVFARNFGKSQALQAGFRAARGEYIVTLDGDLQDDPHEIPNFLARVREGNVDLVCGWKQRRLDSFGKRLVSRFANGLTRFFTGTKIHDMNCGYKLYRRCVVEHLSLNGDMHRYIPSLVAAQGFRIDEIPVHHRERRFGTSKYGNFRRLFKSLFDFVTLLLLRSFMDRPMHFFGLVGTTLASLGMIILGYLAYIKIVNDALIGHRPILMLGILLVVIGVQLFSSGFLAELIVRQNREQKLYTIREELEFS